MDNIDSLLDSISLDVSAPGWRKLAAQTTDKNYRALVAFDNVTSYSQLGELHSCPRFYQLMKAEAKEAKVVEDEVQTNVDFAFGHSVGAGVQTFLATNSLDAGLFAGFISWKADYFADNEKPTKRATKNLCFAQIAIEKFAMMDVAEDWELAYVSVGGVLVPAVELSFSINMENGFKHYGHIDLILRHKRTGRLAVGEIKTTGFLSVDEALYANSSQALSYSVILDAIAPGQTDYEVIYFVYSAAAREWQVMPFIKSLTQKASWLQDLLLDHSAIAQFRKLRFFPQRGESCINRFNRRCKYFGTCSLTSHAENFIDLPIDDEAETVNFSFSLSQLVDAQRAGSVKEEIKDLV